MNLTDSAHDCWTQCYDVFGATLVAIDWYWGGVRMSKGIVFAKILARALRTLGMI